MSELIFLIFSQSGLACKYGNILQYQYTVFSPINEHSKRRTPLISRTFLFHRPNSDQSLIKNFLKGGQVISGHSN